ncbi:MAG: cupin domain-containing protein [Alphaproteobacteria bacterium]|nr:cupin domain-containing protein [Alphaproteobacteria bacterium]
MELNADFSRRIALHAEGIAWRASPMPGVSRRMLDRIGGEVARATSIVRYDADSRFSAHVHGGGEEFIVLDGVFQDEHGDYPAGSYVRNPPQSRHTPGSVPGCTIFVKLWQFDPADRTRVCTDINRIGAVAAADRPGVRITPLFKDVREDVRIEHWSPGARGVIDTEGGTEIFVLDGDFEEGGEHFGPWGWLRLPSGATATAGAGPRGARLWIKSGHLRFAAAPTQV